MPLILMIDDAAFTRRMLRKALTAEGYEVLEATNEQEGQTSCFSTMQKYLKP